MAQRQIICTSPQNQIIYSVENKIYSGEREGQLEKYMESAKVYGLGGSAEAIIGIYLTPTMASRHTKITVPLGYEAVCAHLETLCKVGAFARAASPNVKLLFAITPEC